MSVFDKEFIVKIIGDICNYAVANGIEPNAALNTVANNILFLLEISTFNDWKPKEAEVVPVPPHGRLVDIDTVISMLEEISKGYPSDSIGGYWISNFSDILKATPTVIPASGEGE